MFAVSKVGRRNLQLASFEIKGHIVVKDHFSFAPAQVVTLVVIRYRPVQESAGNQRL